MVQRLKSGEDIESGKKTITAKAQMPEEFTQLKNRLSQFLNTKVQFTCSAKGKGKSAFHSPTKRSWSTS